MSNDFKISELERRVANLVLVGTVTELEGSKARVQIGGLHTAALPWLSSRIGAARKDWCAPSVGEQVLMVCRNGDPAQGIIVASLGSAASPHPEDNPRIFKTIFEDGASVTVDLDTHEMDIQCAGNATLNAAGNLDAQAAGNARLVAGVSAEVEAPDITLDGNVSISGNLSVGGATSLVDTTVKGVALNPGGSQF